MGLDEAIAELNEAEADPEEVADRLKSKASGVYKAIRNPAYQEGKSDGKDELSDAQEKIASLRKEKKNLESKIDDLEEENPEVAEVRGKLEGQLENKQERINELEGQLEEKEQEANSRLSQMGQSTFRERTVNFLMQNGVVDRDIAEVKAEKAMSDRVQVAANGEGVETKVYEPDGDTPMPLDDETEPHEAFGESLLGEIPDKFVEDNRPGSTGIGEPGSGGSKTMPRSKFEELPQPERRQFLEDGGELVDD